MASHPVSRFGRRPLNRGQIANRERDQAALQKAGRPAFLCAMHEFTQRACSRKRAPLSPAAAAIARGVQRAYLSSMIVVLPELLEDAWTRVFARQRGCGTE
jgi:hypothetical protein